MPNGPKGRCIFTGRGRLIALAVAVGLVLGMAGPTSAQFFNFGGYQQSQPQRGGGWFGNEQRGGGWFGNEQRGGGWFGNDPYAPYQQQNGPPPKAFSPPKKRTPLSSCSDLMTASQSASRQRKNPTTSRGTTKTPRRNPLASLRAKNPRRSRRAQQRRRIPKCRRTMPPTAVMRARSQDGRRARARRTAFMSFARNAGSNSTE